jgi:WD40 repeat protein
MDSKWIISASADKCVQFWDSSTGQSNAILYAHKNSVMQVATSPPGNLFATASGDMTMKLWKYTEQDKMKVSNVFSLLE